MLVNYVIICAVGIILAYIVGSIPTGVIVGKVKGVDIQKKGSKNAGASNALRVMGVIPGLVTLFGDVGKGYLVVYLATRHGFTVPAWFGVVAAIGHCFPPYPSMKFRGGKGVAVLLGVSLAIHPTAALIALAMFVAIVWIGRYISLGSLMASVAFPLFALTTPEPVSWMTFGACCGLAALVWSRHIGNIQRLYDGTERKIGEKE